MAQMDESGELAEALKSAGKDAEGAGDLNSRLAKLIKQAPVMVFMKGEPKAPRCGFSRTLVGILNGTGYVEACSAMTRPFYSYMSINIDY